MNIIGLCGEIYHFWGGYAENDRYGTNPQEGANVGALYNQLMAKPG